MPKVRAAEEPSAVARGPRRLANHWDRRLQGLGYAALVLALLSTTRFALAKDAPSGRAARIREFADRWLGTPYLWGGDSRDGIDCSGFLRALYRAVFAIELPRTTRQQIELGVDLPVLREHPERAWQPGDLIFYIDRAGIPNHVVVYMGNGQLTQSVSGRGVVIDGMNQLWGRRIVARRLLVPSTGEGGFGPIPAAGPIVPHEVPCPPSIGAKPTEVKRYRTRAIDLRDLGAREICELRALASAVAGAGEVGRANAAQLRAHAEWLESIDALKGEIGR